MKILTKFKLAKARKDAEKELGFKIPDCIAKNVLDYCLNKLPYIKKDESYLPLLYRCELPMQMQIMAINYLGEQNRKAKEMKENVRSMQNVTVPSAVS